MIKGSTHLLGMKTYNYYGCCLLIVALACATLSGCETSGRGASSTASASTAPKFAPINQNVGWGFQAYPELSYKHVPVP